MTFGFAFKTSFGHLQDVLARCLVCLDKTSLRYLLDVFLPTAQTLEPLGHWKGTWAHGYARHLGTLTLRQLGTLEAFYLADLF